MMTYISPKPVAMQGLSTWAMSHNVIASRKGTTGMQWKKWDARALQIKCNERKN